MNDKQKIVLVAVATVILGMLVFPPFNQKWSQGQVFSRGYSWIFVPPDDIATVDIGLLITQWLAVLVIGGIACFLLKDR